VRNDADTTPGRCCHELRRQEVLIENVDELATNREDPLVAAGQAAVPGAFSQLYTIYSRRLYSVEDDSADSSAATGTFIPRLGVGREMPNFFIL
jgi:hypothetical protein